MEELRDDGGREQAGVCLQSGAGVKRGDSPREDPNITSRCTGSKGASAEGRAAALEDGS